MVKRTGRLPRQSGIRQYPSSDEATMKALRLRREDKLTTPSSVPARIDYDKIQLKAQDVVGMGEQIQQQGAYTEKEIIANEQALRERVLPPEEPAIIEERRPSLIERLPERIPSPPTLGEIREAGAKITSRVVPPVIGAVMKAKAGLKSRSARKVGKALKNVGIEVV